MSDINDFDDLFLSAEDKAKKKAAAEAKKRQFNDIPMDDIPSLDEEPKEESSWSDTFSQLKEQFKIDDDTMNTFKEKKNEFMGKAKEKFSEANEKAEDFNKKADDTANDFLDYLFNSGKKAAETAKDLFEKGKNAAYDLEDKMRKKDEEEEEKIKNIKHKPEDDLLGGFDSFFDKAKSFADRLEKKVEDRFGKDEEIKITKNQLERRTDDNRKIFGFDDLDGDGDALIDDAIIEK